MAYKINGTTVVDNSRNVCACCVTSCCVTASTRLDAPSGDTASRPGTPATGSIYFDTDEGALVAYNGTDWSAVGGASEAKFSISSDPYCNCSWQVCASRQCCIGLSSVYGTTFPAVFQRMRDPGCTGVTAPRAVILGGDGSVVYSFVYKHYICLSGMYCPNTFVCGKGISLAVGHTFFGKDGCAYTLRDQAKLPQIAACCSTYCLKALYDCNRICDMTGVCSNIGFNAALVSSGGHTETGGYLSLGCTACLGQICALIPYDSMRSSLCPAYPLSGSQAYAFHKLVNGYTCQQWGSCGGTEENKRTNIFRLDNQNAGSYFACHYHGVTANACCQCVYNAGKLAFFGDITDLSKYTYCAACSHYRINGSSSLKWANTLMKCRLNNSATGGSDCETFTYDHTACVAIIKYINSTGGCYCWQTSCCVSANAITYLVRIDMSTNCIKHYRPYANPNHSPISYACSNCYGFMRCNDNCSGGDAGWFDGSSNEFWNRVHVVDYGCGHNGHALCLDFVRYNHTTMTPICGMRLMICVCATSSPTNTQCWRHPQMIAFDPDTCKFLWKYWRGSNLCCGGNCSFGFQVFKADFTNCCICYIAGAEIPCWKSRHGLGWGKGIQGSAYNCLCCEHISSRNGIFTNNNGDVYLSSMGCGQWSSNFNSGKIAKSDWTAVTCDVQMAQILPCGAQPSSEYYCYWNPDCSHFVCYHGTYSNRFCYMPCYCNDVSSTDNFCKVGSCYNYCVVVNPPTTASEDCHCCYFHVCDCGYTTAWALCWIDRAHLTNCCTCGADPVAQQRNFSCP